MGIATGSSFIWGRRAGPTFLDVSVLYAVVIAGGADGFHRQ
jgi:hypothetical protein